MSEHNQTSSPAAAGADAGARPRAQGRDTGALLSLVIPVYCNAESLPELKQQLDFLEAQLAEREMQLETIFVDDGSTDGSFAGLMTIRQERPGTKVIRLTRNFGAVAATKTGLAYVEGDCFGILSADLQEPPEQVVKMVDRWRAGDKFVISVRRERDDPFMTRLFSAAYYFLFRWFVIPGYPQGGFDLMLTDKSFMPHMSKISKHIGPEIYAYWLGVEPTTLVYDRLRRKYGKSKWTFVKKLNYFVDNFTGFSATPLRAVSVFGLLSALVSFVYGLFIFVDAIVTGSDVPGFATLAVLISFFSGMILFILAIIGEYLWRIFDILSGKPEGVVDEVHL